MRPQIETLRETYHSFQTTYRELRQQFTTLRQRYYLIECAWCQGHIRWVPKAPSLAGNTSHGICRPCATRLLTPLAARAVGSPAVAERAWHSCASVATEGRASPGASSRNTGAKHA